jgi:hypothetical protein
MYTAARKSPRLESLCAQREGTEATRILFSVEAWTTTVISDRLLGSVIEDYRSLKTRSCRLERNRLPGGRERASTLNVPPPSGGRCFFCDGRDFEVAGVTTTLDCLSILLNVVGRSFLCCLANVGCQYADSNENMP